MPAKLPSYTARRQSIPTLTSRPLPSATRIAAVRPLREQLAAILRTARCSPGGDPLERSRSSTSQASRPGRPRAGSSRPAERKALVLVVAPEPEWPRGTLVPAGRGAVQEEVVTHRRFEPARRGHVGAMDDAVRELVGAEPRRLGDVSGRVRSGPLCHLLDHWRDLALQERLELLLGVGEAHVAVE